MPNQPKSNLKCWPNYSPCMPPCLAITLKQLTAALHNFSYCCILTCYKMDKPCRGEIVWKYNGHLKSTTPLESGWCEATKNGICSLNYRSRFRKCLSGWFAASLLYQATLPVTFWSVAALLVAVVAHVAVFFVTIVPRFGRARCHFPVVLIFAVVSAALLCGRHN